jgi:hypothetical protein
MSPYAVTLASLAANHFHDLSLKIDAVQADSLFAKFFGVLTLFYSECDISVVLT